MKKRTILIFILIAAAVSLFSLSVWASGKTVNASDAAGILRRVSESRESETVTAYDAALILRDCVGLCKPEETEGHTLQLKINDTPVTVQWESNESVTALMELVETEPLTISMSMYGGFEQVGSIGSRLPRNDEQTTTSSGDIVLYSGNQIVVFYGSNSWAYTRLGRITDQTASEMAELLGNGDVIITIIME